jgi:hypothetical protein
VTDEARGKEFSDTNFDSWLEKISRIIGKIKRKFLEIK